MLCMSWTAHIARDFFQVWHAETENVVGKDPFLNTDPLLAPTYLNIHFNVTFSMLTSLRAAYMDRSP
jgi:hypothetical protein